MYKQISSNIWNKANNQSYFSNKEDNKSNLKQGR